MREDEKICFSIKDGLRKNAIHDKKMLASYDKVELFMKLSERCI